MSRRGIPSAGPIILRSSKSCKEIAHRFRSLWRLPTVVIGIRDVKAMLSVKAYRGVFTVDLENVVVNSCCGVSSQNPEDPAAPAAAARIAPRG